MTWWEGLQIFGAVLILAAFAANQMNLLGARSLAYLLLNLVGSGILAFLAMRSSQPGFLLLEGTWAAVSLASLTNRLRPQRADVSSGS